jgi:hypothetical protein
MENAVMHPAPHEDPTELLLHRAARLWHMDAATCASVMMRLVADRFLTRTRHGAYGRLDQP